MSRNKGVATVTVAVWCAGDQSDLHWYTARRETSDRYSFVISVCNHASHIGLYHVHVYLNREDGVPHKVAEKDFLMSASRPAPQEATQDGHDDTVRDDSSLVPVDVSIEPFDEGEKPVAEDDGPHVETRKEQLGRRESPFLFWKKRNG